MPRSATFTTWVVTGLGVEVTATAMLDTTATGVVVPARLSERSLSSVLLDTRALLSSDPVVRGLTVATMVMVVEEAPAASVPRLHTDGWVGSPATPVTQLAPGIVTEVMVTPAGTVSTIRVLAESDGPALCTLSVQVIGLPAVTVAGEACLLSARLARAV